MMSELADFCLFPTAATAQNENSENHEKGIYRADTAVKESIFLNHGNPSVNRTSRTCYITGLRNLCKQTHSVFENIDP